MRLDCSDLESDVATIMPDSLAPSTSGLTSRDELQLRDFAILEDMSTQSTSAGTTFRDSQKPDAEKEEAARELRDALREALIARVLRRCEVLEEEGAALRSTVKQLSDGLVDSLSLELPKSLRSEISDLWGAVGELQRQVCQQQLPAARGKRPGLGHCAKPKAPQPEVGRGGRRTCSAEVPRPPVAARRQRACSAETTNLSSTPMDQMGGRLGCWQAGLGPKRRVVPPTREVRQGMRMPSSSPTPPSVQERAAPARRPVSPATPSTNTPPPNQKARLVPAPVPPLGFSGPSLRHLSSRSSSPAVPPKVGSAPSLAPGWPAGDSPVRPDAAPTASSALVSSRVVPVEVVSQVQGVSPAMLSRPAPRGLMYAQSAATLSGGQGQPVTRLWRGAPPPPANPHDTPELQSAALVRGPPSGTALGEPLRSHGVAAPLVLPGSLLQWAADYSKPSGAARAPSGTPRPSLAVQFA